MKITSINFIDTANLPVRTKRNTENAKMVATILENLKKAPSGKSLVIAADSIAKYERYQLQKKLQEGGAQVLVSTGVHAQTNKPVLFVRLLSDKEWKEWNAK
jgi:O-acetylhomoserine/O-acetylserine sulfhydrylase-like pyridoxal-dependent enzyme